MFESFVSFASLAASVHVVSSLVNTSFFNLSFLVCEIHGCSCFLAITIWLECVSLLYTFSPNFSSFFSYILFVFFLFTFNIFSISAFSLIISFFFLCVSWSSKFPKKYRKVEKNQFRDSLMTD